MRALLELVKSLLIGGFLFLMPLGVIIIILGKLLSIAREQGRILLNWLFPGMRSEGTELLFAALILVVIALLAGILARTRPGRRTFEWFEKILLSRLPFYALVRQLIPDSESEKLGGYRKMPIVTVRLDDQTLVGMLVDTTSEGRKIVYLPGAPSALSGTVAIIDADRVEDTGLKPAQFLAGLRRLGAGISAQFAAAAQAQGSNRP